MRKRKKTVLFQVLCLTFFWTTAQKLPEGLPFHKHITRNEYKAGNDNEAIVQGKNGVIYVANNDGLLLYDGQTWQKLMLPNKTKVRSLAAGKDQTIYVGGQGEFGWLVADSLNAASFVALSDSIPAEERFLADIWKIWATDQGVFFVSTMQLIVFKNGVLKTINSPSTFTNSFEIDGEIYLQASGSGLWQWQNDDLVQVPSVDLFTAQEIAFIEPIENKQWLIGTRTDGLYRGTLEKVERFRTDIDEELSLGKLTCVLPLDHGGLLLGTTHQGLVALDEGGHLRYGLNKSNGLNVLNVHHLFRDLTGQVWAATNNGLAVLQVNSPLAVLDERTGIPGAGFSAAVTPGGELLLGSSQGLYRYDDALHRCVAITNTSGTVWYLRTIDDAIWVGHQEGAMRYQRGKVQKFDTPLGAWDFVPLMGKNTILAGNYSNLHVFKNTPEAGWQLSHQIRDINESCRFLVRESDRILWMSHPYKGIYRMTLSEDLTRCIKLELFGKTHGFPADIRLYVFKIRDQIIFTSENGIYEFDASKKRFVACEWLEKLLGKHTSISKLQEDESGNIWYVDQGQVGYIHFEPLKKPTKVTAPFTPIAGEMISSFEHILSTQGKIILGMQTGFIIYDQAQVPLTDYDYPVSIRKVEQPNFANRQIDGGFTTQRSTMVFPYAENAFRFTYGGMDFQSSDRMEYRYRLNGFDKKWSEWTSSTVNEYTNLSEGDYAFEVEAKNIYGTVVGSSPWHFKIAPPWYRTWWAYSLFLLSFGLLSYVLAKRYTQHRVKEYQNREMAASQEVIRLKNETLQTELTHQTKELASMAFSLSQKENAILHLKKRLEEALQSPEALAENISKINDTMDQEVNLQEDWMVFERHFDHVHNNFMTRLREKYPALSPVQNKLCAYLRMNLSSKEIADLMNISLAAVEKNRYRLRKKLGLDQDQNLKEFLFQI